MLQQLFSNQASQYNLPVDANPLWDENLLWYNIPRSKKLPNVFDFNNFDYVLNNVDWLSFQSIWPFVIFVSSGLLTSSENVNNLNNWPFSPKTNTFASLLLSLFLASDRLGKNLLAGISLGLKEIMGLKLNSRLDWSWEMGRGQFWAKFRTTECLWCFNAQVPARI